MIDNQNIDTSIRHLQKYFSEIRNMGYIKSIRKGSTGIGATFEALLGKEEESLEIPDFEGIEIKTRRGYSKSSITLFNAVPTGSTYYEVKRLRDTYGYQDEVDHNLKRLNTEVSSAEMIKVGIFYYFKLKVDRKLQRLILCIYDWDKNLIDESTYWDFDILKEKLYRKLNILALIKAWPNRIAGVEYFKYYKMNIFILKDFSAFIDALENGNITVKLKIGNHYNPERYGMVYSHGIGFNIKENDLDKIYDYYR